MISDLLVDRVVRIFGHIRCLVSNSMSLLQWGHVFVRLPTGVRVKDACFDCEWTETEDASLLRGVYKYGAGNWDAIRMDPKLKLSEVR